MKKLKQWWNRKSYSSKIILAYVFGLIFLYFLAVINAFVFVTFDTSIERTQNLPYVCYYVYEMYACSFEDYLANMFFSFPYLQFVYLSITSISDIIYYQSIPSYFDFTMIVPILIGIYYISIPLTIVSLFIKNRIKKK